MSTISVYLSFNGNCREAMTFYQRCLGGELFFQTLGEHPNAEKMPDRMKACILHGTLTRNGLVIMGSDMLGEDGLKKGNAVSLMLHCDSETEMKECYQKLSLGGAQTYPIAQSFWGTLFGDLTDKFGNQWLLHYKKN
ncbi:MULTISPECIES: VOC family protein [unclassified Arcicella]|uniref:VOC family protein n=1 Tax=unclassified Arcicella TaxID=2644986 RepID=UPI002854B369|nr:MULTISPECIES: VOC family protein [unclassified Arcicella]MDR6563120.1 PhnB protein [Arcicella sp. BE51]MDR6811729.1 PhnB protein [Arcicella sp. BE140]MDR6823254.1 PhnB protein [Arcicella sp. BE139]